MNFVYLITMEHFSEVHREGVRAAVAAVAAAMFAAQHGATPIFFRKFSAAGGTIRTQDKVNSQGKVLFKPLLAADQNTGQSRV